MIDFAPNDKIESLRPFVDEFWQLIFRTSYDTSFVSNKSTLDSWQHYVGTREAVIKRIEWFYGINICSYYDKPIPTVLRNIRQDLRKRKRDLESLPAKTKISKNSIKDSDVQHLMRAHHLPLWPEYVDFSIETVIVGVLVSIMVIGGLTVAAIHPAVTGVHAMLGVTAIYIILTLSTNFIININNRTNRARWRSQMGRLISKRRLKTITAEHPHQWILLTVGKIPDSSSFGTYQNFGGGWDSIVLLNTHTSEHYAVKGRVRKLERYARRLNLPVL